MKKIFGIVAGISLATLFFLTTKEKPISKETFYKKLEKALLAQGLEIFSGKQMAANLIGAIDGKKFSTLAGDIEIYQFTPDHLSLRKAKALGKFSTDNIHFFDVVVNGNYILCTRSLPQNIIDTFLAITDLDDE